jgi:hypothetical protein
MRGYAVNNHLWKYLLILCASSVLSQELERHNIDKVVQPRLSSISGLDSAVCGTIQPGSLTCVSKEIVGFLSKSQQQGLMKCGVKKAGDASLFRLVPIDSISKNNCKPLVFYFDDYGSAVYLSLMGKSYLLHLQGDSLIIGKPGISDYGIDE